MENAIPWVPAVLKTTPQRWVSLVEAIPAELFLRAPAPKEWSALECLRHLVDTERTVFPVRIGFFLRGEDFPAFQPDKDGSKPGGGPAPAALAGEFARLRVENLALLAGVAPADMDRTARHPELGPVTLGEMVHEWAAHDLAHTVQAERALMQPFLEGCGAWKPYFADHVAGGKS